MIIATEIRMNKGDSFILFSAIFVAAGERSTLQHSIPPSTVSAYVLAEYTTGLYNLDSSRMDTKGFRFRS